MEQPNTNSVILRELLVNEKEEFITNITNCLNKSISVDNDNFNKIVDSYIAFKVEEKNLDGEIKKFENIVDVETLDKLKENINKYSQQSNNSISNQFHSFISSELNTIKNNLCSFVHDKINENLNKFYNNMNNDVNDELFDMENQYNLNNIKIYNSHMYDQRNFKIEQYKCFMIRLDYNMYKPKRLFVFNNFIVISHHDNQNLYSDQDFGMKHEIDFTVLYSIKELSKYYCFNAELVNFFKNSTEKKISNPIGVEFEKICKNEYKNIENKKKELDDLIEEQKNNILHYKKLEENEKTVNDLKIELEQELLKFNIEKDSFNKDIANYNKDKDKLNKDIANYNKDKIKLNMDIINYNKENEKINLATAKLLKMKEEIDKQKEIFEKEKKEFYQIKNRFELDNFLK